MLRQHQEQRRVVRRQQQQRQKAQQRPWGNPSQLKSLAHAQRPRAQYPSAMDAMVAQCLKAPRQLFSLPCGIVLTTLGCNMNLK
ncbi:hypothetical protein ACLKA7_012298 [Drosophila subpalustris]